MTVQSQRVLIVDGDSDSRTVYRILLEHHGYVVEEADGGEEAIELARAGDYVAVVTELTLRGRDGHTLLEELRSDVRTRDLCVIVLTARGLEEDRRRAERGGCARFLLKPVEPQQLLHEIATLTQASRGEAGREPD